MESNKIEWFEILEPCTKDEIYVNMVTGECVWNPPPGVLVKKADDHLWWEIFDPKSARFYYYNAKTQKTAWQKPHDCDVLSLTKLQALKRSIHDPNRGEIKKESTATQTTTKISAKNIQKNPNFWRCVSTQTTSPGNPKIKPGYASLSEHALSAYSYDSGCSGDSSAASQSHSSLDSTNYHCFRKVEFCSAESVDSSYFQEQNSVQQWKQAWEKKPMLCVPVWQQHSFELWHAPSRAPPKQHSLDSQSRRHTSQQQLFHSKLKNIDQKKRSTPQHYRKLHSKMHASSFNLENNIAYPPDGTPLAHRRRWPSENRKAESTTSSPQSPLMPLENLHPFSSSKNNVFINLNNYDSYQQHSLDLPLHVYQRPYREESNYTPDLIQTKSRISPDTKSDVYNNERKPMARPKYYNSCKQISKNQSDHSVLLTTSPCCYQMENYLFPLQQYLMEQAKLSGKLSSVADDKDSFSQSDDDSDGRRDDDDHFADDEAMSHHDSSSVEYLDNYSFFDEDYDDMFYSPVLRASHRKGKSDMQISAPKMQNGHKDDESPPYDIPESNHPSCLPSYYESFCEKNMDPFEYNVVLESEENSKGDIQKYAEDNLNRHTKGIFRKKFSIQDMLSWSKDPIRKPMITTTDKSLKRDACDIFKLIQTYMLDHKTKSGQTYEGVVLDIATRGWSKPALRDELYIQICRQTTQNPKRESLVLGWELMAVCLTFFPPSLKFQPYLEGYIKKHQSSSLDPPDLKISQYALVCGKRLEQISHKGAARSSRKPTVEEIEQSRIQIFRPSMFGNSLEEVMALQRKRYPTYSLPWIQTTLSEAVLQLNGAQTEGIFRVPGDIDEINAMKMRIDNWEMTECDDPHVPASLLKQWYRELFEPLIPAEYYEECIIHCSDAEASIHIVNNLPELNRLVFSYLIRFLQVFSAEENCVVTKMDAKNLAMVMAPNCLRCISEDPSVIFENTRKEMTFIQTLIQHLNTSYMEGVI